MATWHWTSGSLTTTLAQAIEGPPQMAVDKLNLGTSNLLGEGIVSACEFHLGVGGSYYIDGDVSFPDAMNPSDVLQSVVNAYGGFTYTNNITSDWGQGPGGLIAGAENAAGSVYRDIRSGLEKANTTAQLGIGAGTLAIVAGSIGILAIVGIIYVVQRKFA